MWNSPASLCLKFTFKSIFLLCNITKTICAVSGKAVIETNVRKYYEKWKKEAGVSNHNISEPSGTELAEKYATKWLRSIENSQKYFMLQDQNSKKYLTAVSTDLKVEGEI